MSSFLALLDDIAVLAKAAAASVDDIVAGSSKAASRTAAVVIDDAAISPQFFQGVSPARELPVVWKIARRSLLNKAIILLAIVLLSAVADWIFPWALIFGGCYLVYEGAEKVIHSIRHRKKPGHDRDDVARIADRSPRDERSIVRSAATTDFVLSIEIMLISQDGISADVWWMRLAMLVLVGLMMTLLVYGAVGLLIKLDDAGRWIAIRGAREQLDLLRIFGVRLVKLTPAIFGFLSIVGTAAMLWVGGHLLMVNLAKVGFPLFENISRGMTRSISSGFFLWCADVLLSALFGLTAGLLILGIWAIAMKVMAKRAHEVSASS